MASVEAVSASTGGLLSGVTAGAGRVGSEVLAKEVGAVGGGTSIFFFFDVAGIKYEGIATDEVRGVSDTLWFSCKVIRCSQKSASGLPRGSSKDDLNWLLHLRL